MINKINLGFGNERSFLKKEKIIKIYNKGNIIISRQKSAENNYEIISIKRYDSPNKKIKKEKSNKKKKIKNKIKEEIIESEGDKIKNVGFILRKSFKDEELENIIDFGPSSIQNRINLNKKNEEDENKIKKIRPYIPDIEHNEPKEINERYLQRTINIFKENEYLIKKVNDILKNSKFINEENIKKEKESKIMRINEERNKIKKFIDDKRKQIKNKEKNQFIIDSEHFNADNIKNILDKEGKEEEKNNNNNEKLKENMKIESENDFIEIIDINKDIKYINAEKWLKNSKEDTEKIKEYVIKIDQKMKEDKDRKMNLESTNINNNKIESVDKAKEIISEIKNNVDINNFDIKKLSKEEQKLLKGGERYNPNQRIKNIKDIKINKNKEPILINSVNSIEELKESNKNMKEAFKRKYKIDKKEKEISKEWKKDNECAKAYLNNFNKGKKINIRKVKEKKNIELENKNDIYNYIYMPKEYENHWYNNKDAKDETEYKHPFLIYD